MPIKLFSSEPDECLIMVNSFCCYHITEGSEPKRGLQKDALEYMSAVLNLDQGGKRSQGMLSRQKNGLK